MPQNIFGSTKGNCETQFEEAIRDCQNKLLDEYDDEATQEIPGRKQFFGLIK